ncbi:hypothetical protein T5B8_12688 [Salinisphaera sp. T5B8]|uniref:WD40/YVTN/BNR-like repeat-containing protein n=1 Tax=unclassified Salinisphaera TaxID=2649847 RepID=UPI0033403274
MIPVWLRPWVLAALLAYAVFGLYWYLFVGYADSWHEQPEQRLATRLAEPVDATKLKLAGAGGHILASLVSSGRDGEVEACAQDGDCPTPCPAGGEIAVGDKQPVLNCLVPADTVEKDEIARRVDQLMGDTDTQQINYLLRGDDQRLQVAARLQGEVKTLDCGPAGHCYLIAQLPDYENNTVFASRDFGEHWHVAAHNVLNKAYVPHILAIDGANVWVEGYRRVYRSEDGGAHWRVLADEARLIAHDDVLISKKLQSDTSESFRWWLDDAGQLYAITGDRYSDNENMTIVRMDAHSGEILAVSRHRGSFAMLANGPGGQLFGIYATREPKRYTLYRLRTGEWTPVLASGDVRLNNLRANAHALLVEKGIGDGEHLLLSEDGGAHWRAMASLRYDERAQFAPTKPGWLRFGYRNRQGYYGYRWIRP